MCVSKFIILSYIQISTIYIPTYLIGKLSNKNLWRNLQALEVLRGPIGVRLNRSSPGRSFLASCCAYSGTPILICWCHCSRYLFPLGDCWRWVSWPSFRGSRLLSVLFIGWPSVSSNESPFPEYVLGWQPGASVSGRSLAVVMLAIGLAVVRNRDGWWLLVSGSFETLAVPHGLSFLMLAIGLVVVGRCR